MLSDQQTAKCLAFAEAGEVLNRAFNFTDHSLRRLSSDLSKFSRDSSEFGSHG